MELWGFQGWRKYTLLTLSPAKLSPSEIPPALCSLTCAAQATTVGGASLVAPAACNLGKLSRDRGITWYVHTSALCAACTPKYHFSPMYLLHSPFGPLPPQMVPVPKYGTGHVSTSILAFGTPKTVGTMFPFCPHVGPQDGRGYAATSDSIPDLGNDEKVGGM